MVKLRNSGIIIYDYLDTWLFRTVKNCFTSWFRSSLKPEKHLAMILFKIFMKIDADKGFRQNTDPRSTDPLMTP